MMIADRLLMLGHALPAVANPAANCLAAMQGGGLLFVSGQIAQRGASVEIEAIVELAEVR